MTFIKSVYILGKYNKKGTGLTVKFRKGKYSMLYLVSKSTYTKNVAMHITKVYRPIFDFVDMVKDKQ